MADDTHYVNEEKKQDEPQKEGMPLLKKTKLILATIIFTLFAIVLLQNSKTTTLKLLFWEYELNFIVVLTGALLVGALLMLLIRRKFKKSK
jgi:uncharacterized integral membrane protein